MKPNYRYLKIQYDKWEPRELINGAIRYFSDYDFIEIERRGNVLTFLGMSKEMVKQEAGKWTIGKL